MGYGIVASVFLTRLAILSVVVRGDTYMPEFPPVTINTLPLRSGRVLG